MMKIRKETEEIKPIQFLLVISIMWPSGYMKAG